MRILFLIHSFNSLAQRLYVELQQDGHEISVEFDINDQLAEQAVAMFQPDLILAPFLKRRIADPIWQNHRCIVVHPGVIGDRGPSALDWAIMRQETRWGVSCIQANETMDGGAVWASVEFPMREASKSSLYRNEVTEAAVVAVRQTLARISAGEQPVPLDYRDPSVRGRWNDPMPQSQRRIDWLCDDTATIVRKIRAADSMPGLRDEIGGRSYYLYNAHAEHQLGEGLAEPGSLLATRDGAICLKTRDAAVWITHLRHADPKGAEAGFKLPAAQLLQPQMDRAPAEHRVLQSILRPEEIPPGPSWQEIRYRETAQVGYLSFDFYNGAMSTEQCQRLQQALQYAKQRPVKVLVLLGGDEFWSNGIHLNQIEAAESPAQASWENINAMNDLCLELLDTPDQFTLVAMRGNAGAGGVFLALAADRILARRNVVLNPHYRSMGNLYGSEYWTYLLPARVGEARAERLMQSRLPVSASRAKEIGLLDQCLDLSPEGYLLAVQQQAEELAESIELSEMLAQKQRRRQADEIYKPLARYREEELEQMKLNFFGFDPSYHVARYHFVEKLAKARTPAYLAHHRKLRGLHPA
ncbi:hydrogenase maturation protein [Neptuniibacter halophilus]|uniref:hydrogenase maturation protein n=1 Tax=Neptuniibacter halophilus TaxID=651666 RepID=UPI002573C9AA|nr:hydrogenase maturation protein [Neptuniibacter halophilus]